MFTKCARFQPICISHCSHLPFHRDVLVLHTETVGTALTLSAWTNTKNCLRLRSLSLASQTHNNHFSERRMTTTVLYKPLEISLNTSKGIRKHIVLEIISNTSVSVFSVMYAGMSLIPVYFQVLKC